jgi:hypothetical protein
VFLIYYALFRFVPPPLFSPQLYVRVNEKYVEEFSVKKNPERGEKKIE